MAIAKISRVVVSEINNRYIVRIVYIRSRFELFRVF